MMNSVITKVPRMGDTRSASDMMRRTKSYSRTISMIMSKNKNNLMFSLKIFLYENSSLIIKNMATKMHMTKKWRLFQFRPLRMLICSSPTSSSSTS